MLTVESSLLSTLLALAASFLAFSVAVQIFQELWKFLTSSKSRAYLQALEDFLGTWANDFLRQNGQTALRGPFQLFRFKPGRNVLPMSKEALATGLEKTAPPWVRRTMEAIDTETALQNGTAGPPSRLWQDFIAELFASSDRSAADDVRTFLEEWGSGKTASRNRSSRSKDSPIDARQLRIAFRHRFLRDADSAVEKFPQFQKNVDFYYRRRNMRQTFTIALIFTFFFNLPFDVLYKKASAVSPDEAAALAEKAISLYDRSTRDSIGVYERKQLLADATQAVAGTLHPDYVDYLVDLKTLRTIWNGGIEMILHYILGLLITALLVSFGAPVWNDLTSLLLRARKSSP